MPISILRVTGRQIGLITALVVSLATFATPAHSALPDTSAPELQLNRTIRTTPFAGSSVSMKDNEGSAYVPRDNSLWLANDDGRMIHEVNASTGALKRSFDRTAFAAVRQLGGGPLAGTNRDGDLESLAYDAAADTLYVFSGSCCSSSVLPTVFRLSRNQSGTLQLDSFQPLPKGSDFTAAGWNPGDGKLYVAPSKDFRSYTYTTNTVGAAFTISGVSGILGMTFSANGADLFVARSSTRLSRVNWATKSLVPGWTFDLSPFGMRDTRAVELINDQFWVSDGYDGRATNDPLRDAVFVFDVLGSSTAPTASFTATPTSGQAPLTVNFTDTSTVGPTSWLWDFGDGQSSSSRNPSNVYAGDGTYTVRLTASNSSGGTTATRQITVSPTSPPPPPPPPGGNLIGNDGFEASTDGWNSNGVAAVTLARVPGGHSGSWSAKLTNTGTSSVTNALNDAPNWVETTSAGTYTGSLWVRSDTAGAKLYLRVREYQGSTKVGEKLVGIVLSTTWQQVTASLVPVAPGASSIDFAAAIYSAPPGSTFYADDASLTFS